MSGTVYMSCIQMCVKCEVDPLFMNEHLQVWMFV